MSGRCHHHAPAPAAFFSADLFPPALIDGPESITPDAGEIQVYPGQRRAASLWLTAEGEVRPIQHVAGNLWSDGSTKVDVRDGRTPVLVYGSNLDPVKLLHRLTGDVYLVRAAVLGHAAVWCDGRRRSDRQVVATLAPVPGRVEVHGVLLLDAAQLEVVDAWEGHPDRYRRMPFDGTVVVEGAQVLPGLQVYLGVCAERLPLQPQLLLADAGHEVADGIVAADRLPPLLP